MTALLKHELDTIPEGHGHVDGGKCARCAGRRLLLEKGADVNVQEGKYGTALQATPSEGHEVIVKLLLKNWGGTSDELKPLKGFGIGANAIREVAVEIAAAKSPLMVVVQPFFERTSR